MKKDMKIEKIQINKLKPATYNPRQISTKQYKDLKLSVSMYCKTEQELMNELNEIGVVSKVWQSFNFMGFMVTGRNTWRQT